MHDPWHELLLDGAAAILTVGGAVFLVLAWHARGREPPVEDDTVPPDRPIAAGAHPDASAHDPDPHGAVDR